MLKIGSSNKGRSFPEYNSTTLQYTINSQFAILVVHDVRQHYVNTTNIFRHYFQIKHRITGHTYITKSLQMFKFRDLV